MGARHIVDIEDIRKNQVVDVAFVTWNEHQRASLGHGFDPLQAGCVHYGSIVHGVEQPSGHMGHDTDKEVIVFGRNFIEVAVGLFSNGVKGLTLVFRMGGHELAQPVADQNVFFDLLMGLDHGACDALPVAVVLPEQLPPQPEGLIFRVLPADSGLAMNC